MGRRERIYIINDIILKLAEYGELSQSTLMSYCGLNKVKHKFILDYLESKAFIIKNEVVTAKSAATFYRPGQKGLELSRHFLKPFEKLLPRRNDTFSAAV